MHSPVVWHVFLLLSFDFVSSSEVPSAMWINVMRCPLLERKKKSCRFTLSRLLEFLIKKERKFMLIHALDLSSSSWSLDTCVILHLRLNLNNGFGLNSSALALSYKLNRRFHLPTAMKYFSNAQLNKNKFFTFTRN